MSRKHPPDSKPRMIALLRKAAECGGVIRAAGHLKERHEHLVETTRQLAEKTHAELMGPGGLNATTYNEACRIAAERLEAEQ
jgi:hypothetical protein